MPSLPEGWLPPHPTPGGTGEGRDDVGLACRAVRVALTIYLAPVIVAVLVVGGVSIASAHAIRAAGRVVRGSRARTRPSARPIVPEVNRPHFVATKVRDRAAR